LASISGPTRGRESCDVASGSRDALNQPFAHGIGAHRHNDRNGGGYPFGYLCHGITGSHDHVRFEADQFGDDGTESLEPPFGRPALEDEVLPFHIAEDPQTLHECSDGWVDRLGSSQLRDRGRGRDDADAIDLPPCCARAASGHAAAPPSSVMNLRRCMCPLVQWLKPSTLRPCRE
jgi:hypothetical protein